jgi:hypothetical protein
MEATNLHMAEKNMRILIKGVGHPLAQCIFLAICHTLCTVFIFSIFIVYVFVL